MGLKKNKVLPNGVELNYHRIVTLTQMVNEGTIIEVQSYISNAKRLEEKNALKIGRELGRAIESNIYIDASIYSIPYDPEITVVKAYDYLKTLPEFENAEDVFE